VGSYDTGILKWARRRGLDSLTKLFWYKIILNPILADKPLFFQLSEWKRIPTFPLSPTPFYCKPETSLSRADSLFFLLLFLILSWLLTMFYVLSPSLSITYHESPSRLQALTTVSYNHWLQASEGFIDKKTEAWRTQVVEERLPPSLQRHDENKIPRARWNKIRGALLRKCSHTGNSNHDPMEETTNQ
jgi:hypothetical protein